MFAWVALCFRCERRDAAAHRYVSPAATGARDVEGAARAGVRRGVLATEMGQPLRHWSRLARRRHAVRPARVADLRDERLAG